MELDASLPWAPFALGVLNRHLGNPERMAEALRLFELCYKLAPEDPDACYRLGVAYKDARRYEESVTLLEKSVSLAPHFSGAWYALNSAFARLRKLDDRQRAFEMFELFEEELDGYLAKKLDLKYNYMGRYACVIRSLPPFEGEEPAPATPIALSFVVASEPGLEATHTPVAWPFGRSLDAGGSLRDFLMTEVAPGLAAGMAIHDLDGDGSYELYVADGRGIGRLLQRREGRWVDIASEAGIQGELASLGGVFADFNHDGRIDLYVYGAGPNRMFLNQGELRFRHQPGLEAGDSITLSAQAVDADHDGDLDLVVPGYLALPDAAAKAESASSFPGDFAGAANHLYNNDRPTIFDAEAKGGGFRDLAPEFAFGSGAQRSPSALVLDFDRDGDADIFELIDGEANRLFLNDRIWRYREEAKAWGVDDRGPGLATLALDLDQDGLSDVALMKGPSSALQILRNESPRGFVATPEAMAPLLGEQRRGLLASADFDNDGRLELIQADPQSALIRIVRPGVDISEIELPEGAQPRSMIPFDLDDDGGMDLIVADASGAIHLVRNRSEGRGNWIKVQLRGKEENAMAPVWANPFGLGAFVEVAAGGRRIYDDTLSSNGYGSGSSPRLHIGLGPEDDVDYLRVIWPDLVIQNELNLAGGQQHSYAEVNRKPSSCPVLFVGRADGSFDFIADFLGVGGLGFFLSPDSYATPDNTEMLRIGEIEEQNGRLELRVLEPMEEICYLDELRLIEVRHPEALEVQVDERLATREPMPTGRPLGLGQRIWPTRIETGRGSDTTDALRRIDRVYQPDLIHDHRFTGYLAEEQSLVVDVDAEALAAARPSPDAKLQLLINAWTEYPYSHVNFAAWQAGVRGKSFSLDLPEGDTWATVFPEFGYPAGMSRTMAIDVSSWLSDGASRFRLRTNLEIYVDALWLAWEDPRELEVVDHAFERAELRFAGYPEERSPDGKQPKLYDYQRISPTFDWKQLSGKFTNYGDVRELINGVDDRYVVMSHGEEIALSIDAKTLAPLPEGWTRTFFLKADGWCKDMDPYTAAPDTVLPLPWHGMDGYPPSPGHDYPAEQMKWMEEWNRRTIDWSYDPRRDD